MFRLPHQRQQLLDAVSRCKLPRVVHRAIDEGRVINHGLFSYNDSPRYVLTCRGESTSYIIMFIPLLPTPTAFVAPAIPWRRWMGHNWLDAGDTRAGDQPQEDLKTYEQVSDDA